MSAPSSEHSFIADWNAEAEGAGNCPTDYRRRALAIWPGLDRSRLNRTHGDPWKIARLVSHRTRMPFESIVALLMEAEPGPGSGVHARGW
jgi:hypothetical protein